jgi:hypothetical protein
MEDWSQPEDRKKRFVLKNEGIEVSFSVFLNRFPR